MPELSKEVRHEIRTGLGVKHDSIRAQALEEMRKEVYTPRGARSVLEELANVKKQEVTEKVIHASLKNAFREVRGGAVVDGDVTRHANAEVEARRWHELHLRGIEGMPAADVGALARRMVEATNDMFKDPRLFASIPEAERVKAFGTIMNSEAYRTAVKTRLDAALLEAQRYDPSQLDAAVTAAEAALAAKEAAYTATPTDATRTDWEESLLALDKAKEQRAKPYGGIEERIQNIGKDALIEVLPAKITAAVDSYHAKEDAQKAATSTKVHDSMSRLSEAWKKRRINRSTFEEEMVVDKRKGNKLKRRMMRKGSEGVLEEILGSKKINAETREAFAQLKKDKPEEYAALKTQAASTAIRDYLNAGGRLSRRELKKIVKQGHEVDLYQIVAMAMRGKNSPADVAANDLKIDDTVRKYLKETPIDRIKPAARWLFTTPQGRMLLYASLAAGAGGLYWINHAAVNQAVGAAATWIGDKATGAYEAIKNAVVGYKTFDQSVITAMDQREAAKAALMSTGTPEARLAFDKAQQAVLVAQRAHPEIIPVPGMVENATNWWQDTAQPAVGAAAKATGEFAFGNPDTGARGALYNAAYTVRAIPPTVEMAGRQAIEPDRPLLMGIGATVEAAKAVANEISKGWQDAAKLTPVPLP